MADAWIMRVALVMVFEHFAVVRDEDRVPVVLSRLDRSQEITMLSKTVWMIPLRGSVAGVDFLAQNFTFERTAGFALFFCAQPRWENRIRQQPGQRISAIIF